MPGLLYSSPILFSTAENEQGAAHRASSHPPQKPGALGVLGGRSEESRWLKQPGCRRELKIVQPRIFPAPREQLLVRPQPDDAPLREHADRRRMRDGPAPARA